MIDRPGDEGPLGAIDTKNPHLYNILTFALTYVKLLFKFGIGYRSKKLSNPMGTRWGGLPFRS